MKKCCAYCRHVEKFSDWREHVDAFFEQSGWCRDFAGLSPQARRYNYAYLVVYLPEYSCPNFEPSDPCSSEPNQEAWKPPESTNFEPSDPLSSEQDSSE